MSLLFLYFMKKIQKTLTLSTTFFFTICLEDVIKESLLGTNSTGRNIYGIHPFHKPLFMCFSPFLLTSVILFLYKKKKNSNAFIIGIDIQAPADQEEKEIFKMSDDKTGQTTKSKIFEYLRISSIPFLSIVSAILIHLSSTYTDPSILQLVHAASIIFASVFSHCFTRHKLNLRQLIAIIILLCAFGLFGYSLTMRSKFNWMLYSYKSIACCFFSDIMLFYSSVLEDNFLHDNERGTMQGQPHLLCFVESIFGVLFCLTIVPAFGMLINHPAIHEDFFDTLIMMKSIPILAKFGFLCLLASAEKVISILIVSETSPLHTFLAAVCGDLVSSTVGVFYTKGFNSQFKCSVVSLFMVFAGIALFSVHIKW